MNSLKLRELSLSKGAHKSPDEGVCVMEVVSYVAGEPFSDHPECACPVLGHFLRSWNDSLNDEDRQMLKQFIPALIGSASSPLIETKRRYLIADWGFRVYAPAWLDLAGLNKFAEDGRKNGAKANWDAARDAAGAAAWDAARAAARAAAWGAARAAAGDATWAAARAFLKPVVLKMQKSAIKLVWDCLAIKE